MSGQLLGDNPSATYYAKNNRLGIAMNLIQFAFGQFNRATCIRRLDRFEELIVQNGKTIGKIDDLKMKQLRPFIFEGLIDSIRISICYENFIKALLLTQGCIVHIIDSNSSTEYHKLQRKRPLRLQDYCQHFPFKKNETNNIQVLPGLTKRTLSFETITKKPYTDQLKIPIDFIECVKNHYERRNEIHFYIEEHFKFGKVQIDELKKLKEYTNKILIQNNNAIADALKSPDEHYLKLEMLTNDGVQHEL